MLHMRRTPRETARRAQDSITEVEDLLAGMESVENPLSRLATIEREQGGVAYEFEGPQTRKEHLEVLESLSRRLWHMATTVVPEELRARILMQPDGGESDLRLLRTYGKLIDLPEPNLEDSLDDDPFDNDLALEGYDPFDELIESFPFDDDNRS